MKRTMRLASVAATLVVIAGAAPEASWGGTYTVEACQSAKRWGYGSDAFELGRSNGLLELDRGCGEWGRIGRERGLTVTVKRRSGRKVANGAYARALFRAPAGMRIARVDWSGSLKRCDAAWQAGVAASGGGPGRWVMLPGRNRFTVGCRTRVRRSAAPAPATLPHVAGATAIYSQVKVKSFVVV